MRTFLMVLALSAMAFVGAADKNMAKPEGTLVLGGLSPVEAVDTGAAVRGEAKFWSAHQGFQYNFPNAASKAKFDAAPEQYAVRAEGNCPVSSTATAKVKGNPAVFDLYEKKLFLFKDAAAKAAFSKDKAKFAKAADALVESTTAAPMKKKKEGS
ncbi:MAG: hypothetical protein WCT04_10485 [Planctomycetota bacterium]